AAAAAVETGRADRNDHQAAGLELLQQRRRDVVDAAGDDDLVEGRVLLPAVVAVGIAGGDRRKLLVAAGDQAVIEGAGAPGQGLDDLDRPDPVGEVREIGRLVARAGADLQDLVASADVDDVGHAGDGVRPGDGHAIADIE